MISYITSMSLQSLPAVVKTKLWVKKIQMCFWVTWYNILLMKKVNRGKTGQEKLKKSE